MIMINSENYYSAESSKSFMSVSQFKSFMECEAKAMAEISGEFRRETTNALLIGSYVDSFFEGTLDTFKKNHPEIFLKSGGLKADFVQADEIIQRVQRDEEFMKYMSGESQKIFTGNIAGVPFKGKLDSYHAGKCIVDLKVMRDFEPVWKNGKKQHFIEAWGYDIQGAVYQELVYQATGQKLPFVICAVTKEKVPDIAIFSIPQVRLDYCLGLVMSKAPHFQAVKTGAVSPERCEKCDFCKLTKKLEGAVDYRDFSEPSETHETEPVSVLAIPNDVILPEPEKPVTEPASAQKKHKKKSKKKKDKSHRKIIIKF